MDNQKNSFEMTDEQIINRVIPAYARALNWIYSRTVEPVERLVEYVRASGTRHMIAEFENAEARREAAEKH